MKPTNTSKQIYKFKIIHFFNSYTSMIRLRITTCMRSESEADTPLDAAAFNYCRNVAWHCTQELIVLCKAVSESFIFLVFNTLPNSSALL